MPLALLSASTAGNVVTQCLASSLSSEGVFEASLSTSKYLKIFCLTGLPQWEPEPPVQFLHNAASLLATAVNCGLSQTATMRTACGVFFLSPVWTDSSSPSGQQWDPGCGPLPLSDGRQCGGSDLGEYRQVQVFGCTEPWKRLMPRGHGEERYHLATAF